MQRSMTLATRLALALALVALAVPAVAQDLDESGADSLGWKLSIQAWTNNQATLFETFELAQRIGIHYVEAFPGQRLSPDFEGGMGPEMTPEQIEAFKAKCEECGVKVLNFGVTGVPGDDEGAEAFFDWAKEIGLETIVCEPGEDQIRNLDIHAAEYEMKIAIHNHPQPSHYWNPETVLNAIEAVSRRVGACADTGHWVRSGLDPIECLQQLRGRIVSLHFKDLNARTGEGLHDVVWGTGESDAAGQLAELANQEFEGVISMEYEHQWDEDALRQCVVFFHETANAIAEDLAEAEE